MRLGLAVFPVFLAACCVGASAQTTRPSRDPADDPRAGLQRFFDAIRSADKTAAMQCWHDDLRQLEWDRRITIGTLVSHLVDEMIAEYRLEHALATKMPDARRRGLGEAGRSGGPTPTDDELAKAQFTIYRRLAVINWGRDESSGFPMVYIRGDEPRWKISKLQWYSTTHSSVGDALLFGGFSAKAKDATTADILAGKFKTIEQVNEAYGRHMDKLIDAEKAKRGGATAK
jgi:hypothetical protein